MRQIKKGSTDRSVIVRVIDSTDGTPEEGVTFETAGIDLWYRREGAVRTAITEATLATVDAAHADGGFIHIDDGYCRLDLPDAAWATGASHVMIGGTITGMIVIGQEVQLVNYDPEDGVRLGLTALPNAAADAAGGLPISDAGGLDLDAQIGTKINDILTDTGTTLDGRIPAALVGGRMDSSVGAVAANAITAAAIADAAIDAATFAAGAINAAAIAADAIGASELAADAVAEIADQVWDEVRAGHTTAGTFGEVATAAAIVDAVWDEARADHTAAGSFGQGAASVQGNVTGSVASVTGAVGSVTGAVGSVAAGGITAASIATGAIDADAIAADAIGASELAADAVAEIADQVWDEVLAGHAGAGSAGAALTAAGSAGDPWSTPIPGAYGAGTAGKIVGDNLNAPVGTVDTVVDGIATMLTDVHNNDLPAVKSDTAAILVDTGTTLDGRIPAALVGGRMDSSVGAQENIDFGALQKASLNAATPASVVGAVGSVTGNVGGNVVGSVGSVTGAVGSVTGDVGGLAAAAITDVETAVDNQLSAAIAEPANLAATKSVKSFLWFLFSRFFHKNTQTATQQKTYKADAVTVLATRAVSDDGTTQDLGAGA